MYDCPKREGIVCVTLLDHACFIGSTVPVRIMMQENELGNTDLQCYKCVMHLFFLHRIFGSKRGAS